jgi:hypothetical protein
MSFTVDFECQGPKDPSANGLWQIWKIHNKWHGHPDASTANAIVWEIQYWEDYPELGTNKKYYIGNKEMMLKYKDQLNEWKRLHAEDWTEYYGGKNPWTSRSASADLPEPVSVEFQRVPLGIQPASPELQPSTPKRDFEDTPRKPRYSSDRKKRLSDVVEDDITDDSQAEDPFSGPQRQTNTSIARRDYKLMPPPARPAFVRQRSAASRFGLPRRYMFRARHCCCIGGCS